MYQSEIANDLKIKIDKEMENLVGKTKMITLDQRITNSSSKEDLKRIKAEIISYQDYIQEKKQTLNNQKKLILTKNAGFVNTLTLSLFIMVIAVGIGYMLFRFGI